MLSCYICNFGAKLLQSICTAIIAVRLPVNCKKVGTMHSLAVLSSKWLLFLL